MSMQHSESIQIISDKQEITAPGAVRLARYLLYLALGMILLLPFSMWMMSRFSQQIPPDTLHLLMLMQGAIGVLFLAYALLRWRKAKQSEVHYLDNTLVYWTFRCDDIQRVWEITGFDACEGWRDVIVRTRRVPKRSGAVIAVPELEVTISNEDDELANGRVSQSGKITQVGTIDKAGGPMRIPRTPRPTCRGRWRSRCTAIRRRRQRSSRFR
ncbi:MAG: hypothetical protein HRU13_04670 [Phycisphaerales bacterium]|nr:hypothetical protein [Phycisphaerales bacterium]